MENNQDILKNSICVRYKISENKASEESRNKKDEVERQLVCTLYKVNKIKKKNASLKDLLEELKREKNIMVKL